MESKFFFLLLRFAGSVLPPSHMRGIGIIGRRVLGFLARRISPHIGAGRMCFRIRFWATARASGQTVKSAVDWWSAKM